MQEENKEKRDQKISKNLIWKDLQLKYQRHY